MKSLSASAGWRWVVEGARLAWRAPLVWLALIALLFAFALLAVMVPAVGAILLYLLSPGLLGGLLIGCRDSAHGEGLRVPHLFAGFSRHPRRLLGLGLFYTASQAALLALLALALGADPSALADLAANGDRLPAASLSLIALTLFLSIPLTMLMWFAPALVVFRDMAAWPAMRYSLAACLFQWRPYLLNGLAMSALLLPALLFRGLGLLLWVPLMVCGQYAAYVDIFGDPARAGVGDGGR